VTTLGVVSDTHLPRFGLRLPRALLDGLAAAGVARILHAGDHTAGFVVDQLASVAPVDAVAGNNDPPELVERLGTRRVLEIDGRRVGLTHGHLGIGRTTPERARRSFEAHDVDVVVFGHSHQPLWLPGDGSGPGLLNPGSPTDRRRERAFSFALVDLDSSGIRARIVRFTDRGV
jgi:putative phosphoesterase